MSRTSLLLPPSTHIQRSLAGLAVTSLARGKTFSLRADSVGLLSLRGVVLELAKVRK